MTYHSETLAALIGSRICHDLISPIGAVNNGLELLALSQDRDGPEMALVTDSANSANARICLFRLAFGLATPDQVSRADDLTAIWRGVYPDGRFTLDWQGPATLPRREARLLALACLCVEAALPQGGKLRILRSGESWHVRGTGPCLALDEPLWRILSSFHAETTVAPAHVQFLLLSGHLHEMGRLCRYERGDNHIGLSF